MAGSYTRRNASKDFTNNSGTSDLTLIIFRISTFTFTFTLGLLGRYMHKNLQKATKLILKLFVKGQKHSQL